MKLLKELMEMYDEDRNEELRRAIQNVKRQAEADRPQRRSPEEIAAQRQRQKEYNEKRQQEHEWKMKNDTEYRKKIERTGKAWASYGKARAEKDPSIVGRGPGGARSWTGD